MTAKTYTALLIAYMIAVFGIVIHQKLKTRNRDGNIRTILILACALISMAVENRQILETIKEKILKLYFIIFLAVTIYHLPKTLKQISLCGISMLNLYLYFQ